MAPKLVCASLVRYGAQFNLLVHIRRILTKLKSSTFERLVVRLAPRLPLHRKLALSVLCVCCILTQSFPM